MPPFSADPTVFDQYFTQDGRSILKDPDATLARLAELRAQPNAEELLTQVLVDYRWKVFALKTRPRTLLDLFFSSRAERSLYVMKLATAGSPYTQLGVRFMETPSVKAIIFLGDPKDQGKVFAELSSHNGKIGQGMYVSSDSWDASRDAIFKTLSAFRYSLEELPGKEDLNRLVATTLEQHEKFLPATEDPG